MIWSWVESSGLHQGPADPWVQPPLRWELSPSSFACGSCQFCVAFLRGASPPTLVSVLVQNLKTKYGTNKKGTLPDWNPGRSNFIILK